MVESATAWGDPPPELAAAQHVESDATMDGMSKFDECVVRLLVADDHPAVRTGFVALLNRQPDFKVIGEAAYGEEAIRLAETLTPDAIIMDVDMPMVDGIEATRRIKTRRPQIIIVGFSFHDSEAIIRAMADAGADSYVSKQASAECVIDAVRRACHPIVARWRNLR